MTNILEETGYFWWSDLTIPTGYVAPEAAVVGKLTIDEEGQSHLELEGVFPNELGPLAALGSSESPYPRASVSMGY